MHLFPWPAPTGYIMYQETLELYLQPIWLQTEVKFWQSNYVLE